MAFDRFSPKSRRMPHTSRLRGSGNLIAGAASQAPAIVLLAAAIATGPQLFRGNSCGHDFDFHLVSWFDCLSNWRNGILYPQWAPSPNFGAGEPRFVFYPPLTWMLGAALGSGPALAIRSHRPHISFPCCDWPRDPRISLANSSPARPQLWPAALPSSRATLSSPHTSALLSVNSPAAFGFHSFSCSSSATPIRPVRFCAVSLNGSAAPSSSHPGRSMALECSTGRDGQLPSRCTRADGRGPLPVLGADPARQPLPQPWESALCAFLSCSCCPGTTMG